jgi:hypothetical protein
VSIRILFAPYGSSDMLTGYGLTVPISVPAQCVPTPGAIDRDAYLPAVSCKRPATGSDPDRWAWGLLRFGFDATVQPRLPPLEPVRTYDRWLPT